MPNLEQLIRRAAKEWVDKATLEELMMVLPKSIYLKKVVAPQISSEVARVAGALITDKGDGVAMRRPPAKRIPKVVNHDLTEQEGSFIKTKLQGIEANSKEYEQIRKELCLQLSITKKQFAGFIGGMNKKLKTATNTPLVEVTAQPPKSGDYLPSGVPTLS